MTKSLPFVPEQNSCQVDLRNPKDNPPSSSPQLICPALPSQPRLHSSSTEHWEAQLPFGEFPLALLVDLSKLDPQEPSPSEGISHRAPQFQGRYPRWICQQGRLRTLGPASPLSRSVMGQCEKLGKRPDVLVRGPYLNESLWTHCDAVLLLCSTAPRAKNTWHPPLTLISVLKASSCRRLETSLGSSNYVQEGRCIDPPPLLGTSKEADQRGDRGMKKPPAPAKAPQTPLHSRTVQQISRALGVETARGNSSPDAPEGGGD